MLIVVAIVAGALSLLFLSRNQGQTAQTIEAAVALLGAAAAAVNWLLQKLKRKALEPAVRSVIGLSAAVPTGDLPNVVRGREQVTERLRQLFRKPGHGPAVLAGPGGAGKSTIAISFAEACEQSRFGHPRHYVWWISAADQASLIGGLVTVARQLGAGVDDLEVIRSAGADATDRLWELLDASRRRWLLVLDNADNPAVLANPAAGTGWVRSSRRGLVVVTTRLEDRTEWGRDAEILPVGRLREDDAAWVLLDLAPHGGDVADARKLAERLGGLPLPLRIAGLHLGSDAARFSAFTEYLREFEDPNRRPRMLSFTPGIGTPDKPRQIVMRTWELSLDDLARQGLPQARLLLRVLSCLAAPIPIPREILTGPALERLLDAGAQDIPAEHRLEDTLHGLRTRGLIEIRPAGAIIVQPVIADTNRAHLADATDGERDTELIRSAAVEIIVGSVAGLNPDQNTSWPRYMAIGPHMRALYDTLARRINPTSLAGLVDATIMTARAYNCMGRVAEGERLSRAACGVVDLVGRDERVSLHARADLAWCLVAQERWAEAETIYNEVLAASRRAFGDEDPTTITTRNELAWATACQHRWAEAEAAYREVLDERTRVLGADHMETLITRHELAWVIANQEGRERDAEPLLREVLTARKRVLRDDDRRILLTRRDLAWITTKLGENPQAAVTTYQELVRSFRRDLGEQHKEALTTWHELAWAMALAGRRRAALSEYRKVLRAQEQALGANHPETMASREALAKLRDGIVRTPRHVL